jgi:N-acetylglutamate synthase
MTEIRTLGPEDYDAICEVWQASGVGYQPTGRESRDSFTRQMSTGLQTVFGAVEDGRLVGVVVATQDGRKGWINRLGVHPGSQRRGIGAKLVQACEGMFHEMGLTISAALVVHGNEASLNLFKREGFQVNDAYYLTKRDHPDA